MIYEHCNIMALMNIYPTRINILRPKWRGIQPEEIKQVTGEIHPSPLYRVVPVCMADCNHIYPYAAINIFNCQRT